MDGKDAAFFCFSFYHLLLFLDGLMRFQGASIEFPLSLFDNPPTIQ
nr:MAG TPA: hypothetical protein [Caudoviricetes sp.]